MEYPRFHTTIPVFTHDADCYGNIKTRRLSQLVSDVATMHTKVLHVDRDTMLKDGITWMLHSVYMKIEKMPRSGDVMEIDTYPCGIERLFALRCFDIRDKEGDCLVRMSSRWMQIDVERRRPIRPTSVIVALNEGLSLPENMTTGCVDAKNFPADVNEVRRFVATFDNIDFNGHVTQSSYMKWMTDSLTFGFYKEHVLCEAEVIYEHEIMPEADVVAWIKVVEDGDEVVAYHKLTSADGTIEHCLGRTVWKKHTI